MMELKTIKDLHDKAFVAGQTVRERAADDMLFARVTQWDDNVLNDTTLTYRGEFNIVRKATRQILQDLRSNQVQVDFRPVEENKEEASEVLDGLYRASSRENISIEAFDNAAQEAVDCGVGGWELYTEYVTSRGGDTKQVIRRRPLYEANNQVFFDPNAKRLDKSDAKYCSVLVAYSQDGYRELVKELTGEDPGEVTQESFAFPEQSYTFIWISDDLNIWVSNFYLREKYIERLVELEDQFGAELEIRGENIGGELKSLEEEGYTVVSEKRIERYRVKKYIASGREILAEYDIPGGEIPVIPTYGERGFVEGTEWYEGVTRLAKDPQRLRNFQLSYLGDIVSRSPREKPIFTPEQIGRWGYMYEEAGSENAFPFVYQERFDGNGNPLPMGPVGMLPNAAVPPALMASIDLSRQAVEDVANPGIPQDIADPDLSGKAVTALQNRLDQQSMVYQQNLKMAKRRDGMVFAAMASVIYDTPRRVMVVRSDDEVDYMNLMEQGIDADSGEMVMHNDITGVEFNVWADIGPDYSSKREQTLDRLEKMIAAVPEGDPMRNILMLKAIRLMSGVDFDDVRDYANRQLMVLGIKEPETEEDRAFMQQQQQQGEKPDPAMVLAQAELLKAQAQQSRAQLEALKAQADAQNAAAGTQIDAFEAETDRMNTLVQAEKAGADIGSKQADTFGKQLDNAAKVAQAQIARYRAAVNAAI